MKLYYASGEVVHHANSALKAVVKPCMLASYYIMQSAPDHLTKHVGIYGNIGRMFVDSGAFSAFTKGAIIDIDAYAAFIKRNKDWITVYANLDVIGDWRASLKNQTYLEAIGLAPMPVFHHSTTTDYGVLEDMCQRYDYIAMGGIASRQFTRDQNERHLDRCWSIIGKHFKAGRQIKVHGLGTTGQHFLERYPWYTVDSITWCMGEISGTVMHWDGRSLSMSNYRDKASTVIGDYKVHLNGPGDYKYRSINNARAMWHMQQFVTELWAKRGVVWDDDGDVANELVKETT